jgi:hypothetical protein
MRLGALRDPPEKAVGDPILRLLAKGEAEELPQALVLSYVRPTIVQRGNSCYGAAFAHALRGAARRMGYEIDPSYLAIYALARELEHPGARTLPDEGSYTHRVLEAITDWGVVDRKRWQDWADILSPTPIDVKEAGSLALVTGIYRIYETGIARTTRIREAIAQGHHVVFGMEVDRAYEEWRGSTPYPGLRGPALGGHAQVLVGYAPGRFLVLNSWGPAWGEDGYVWITDEALEGEHVYDFTVVTVAPTRPV